MDIETYFTGTVHNYEILDKIDEGGMGVVFKARHIHMNRIVALKVGNDLPDIRQKFQKEIEITSQLNHPNIVAVYDANVHCDFPYFVMEFVEGKNIRQLIKEGFKFTYQDFLKIVEIVNFLHKNQIIHRDIKPQNVIINNGNVKLLDLGLAKRFGENVPSEEGKLFGSPDWMAPEQARNGNGIDHRADIYSLGCLWYYMMTGREVFERNAQLPVIFAHQEENPPKFPIRKYDKYFQKMLEKDPEDRLELRELFVRKPKIGAIAACFVALLFLLPVGDTKNEEHIERVQSSKRLDYPFVPKSKHNKQKLSTYPFKRSKKRPF